MMARRSEAKKCLSSSVNVFFAFFFALSYRGLLPPCDLYAEAEWTALYHLRGWMDWIGLGAMDSRFGICLATATKKKCRPLVAGPTTLDGAEG